jgi:phosphatidylglycerol:prolipoprotein diacylglycerol transferase
LAGDGDWGPPTTLPWGVAYTKAIIGWDYPPGVRVHPSALYETIAYTLIFAILWRYRTVPHAPGALFWGYLVLSSLARFLIEFLRINPPLAFGLSEAQMISIVLMAIGMVMLMKRTTHNPVAETATPLNRVAREKQR